MKKFYIITVTLFGMANQMTGQPSSSFRALSVNELNSVIEIKSSLIDESYQLDFNKAFVTIFKDRTATIVPGNGNGEGILFNDLKILKRMIGEKKFPVKGDSSFWESEKERVLNFYNSIDYYCAELSRMLNYEVVLSNSKSYLKSLSKIISEKIGVVKFKNRFYGYLAIYVGELVRLKTGSQWKLFPQYTLNVYYIPEIVNRNMYCNHWNYVFNVLDLASFLPIDLEALIDECCNFSPYTSRDYVDIK